MITGLLPADLLRIWEQGYGESIVYRGLVLLQAAFPHIALPTLASLSIGQRDAALLLLYQRTFGALLDGYAQCPECGTELTVALDTRQLRLMDVPDSPAPPELLVWQSDDMHLVFRLPTSADLLALEQSSELAQPDRFLWERCIISAARGQQACAVSDLPEPVLDALSEQMESHDPQAQLELELHCMTCGARWSLLFDIVTYLWREIESAARQTLREIHTLAKQYGWAEADILRMSPWRRQIYLGMVGA